MKIKPLATFLLALTLATPPAIPSAAAEGLPDLGDIAQSEFSPQMERRIGEAIMREIRRDPAYLDDPEISAYLNQLGAKLVAASTDTHQSFEFFVVSDNTLNAFAMPGGYIGVHTGLILAAQNESELASVLAHEIAHVTQRHLARLISKSGQNQLISIASIIVAILAARSNPQISQAVLMTGSAAQVQSQINYTREFEREADRVGIQVLEGAHYDVRGMAAFFERLQKVNRLYENNAPAYLLTHPLTTERIADLGNRIQQLPYKQVADSLDFQLVRAKLRAEQGTPREAVTEFQAQLQEKRFSAQGTPHYGLARAFLRAGDYAAAEREVATLRRLKTASPMVETLAAELKLAQGDAPAALQIYRDALARYPLSRALSYGHIDALLSTGNAPGALRVASAETQTYPSDPRLHGLLAKTYAALGKRVQQHRAQAEVYALKGQLQAAIEQLQIAQKSGDGDFYELSAVDSRLRELKARQVEEMKETKEAKK